MKNKQVKQMMVDVEVSIMTSNSGMLSDRECIVWFDGPCYISGGNFIWLCSGVVSLTSGQLKGK